MRGSRSELEQPVAPLFAAERSERQRRAVPVLRRIRSRVADGGFLTAALLAERGIEREFARHELVRAVCVFGVEIEKLDLYGDVTLRLCFVDRALRACGALHRGGHFVTSGRRSA